MFKKNVTELPRYSYSIESKDEIFIYLKNELEQLEMHGKIDPSICDKDFDQIYMKIIDDVIDRYSVIALEHLSKNFEIESKRYTDKHIVELLTIFLSLGAFIISIITSIITSLHLVFSLLILCVSYIGFVVVVGSITFIFSNTWTPKATYISGVNFIIKKALEKKREEEEEEEKEKEKEKENT